MSEVLSNLLKLVLGIISSKIRDYKAIFRDVVINDREHIIIRELNDVKVIVGGDAFDDFIEGIRFLEEKIPKLDEISESGSPSWSELPVVGESSRESKRDQQLVTEEDKIALASAVENKKIMSETRFEAAKKSFKCAREKATNAFCNMGLTTGNRLLACKVSIVSRILEHLDDPENAAVLCLRSMEELNVILAPNGGIWKEPKSWFKSDSRPEIMETVLKTHLMLADFISRFTKKRMAIFDWPIIRFSTQHIHPIHHITNKSSTREDMGEARAWDGVEIEEVHKIICAFTQERISFVLPTANMALKNLTKQQVSCNLTRV